MYVYFLCTFCETQNAVFNKNFLKQSDLPPLMTIAFFLNPNAVTGRWIRSGASNNTPIIKEDVQRLLKRSSLISNISFSLSGRCVTCWGRIQCAVCSGGALRQCGAAHPVRHPQLPHGPLPGAGWWFGKVVI